MSVYHFTQLGVNITLKHTKEQRLLTRLTYFICLDKCSIKLILRWYGHVRRKGDGYIGRRMLRVELPGKRKRGMPKRRFMDAVRGHVSG